jgi:lipopolysaccharide export system permease protein
MPAKGPVADDGTWTLSDANGIRWPLARAPRPPQWRWKVLATLQVAQHADRQRGGGGRAALDTMTTQNCGATARHLSTRNRPRRATRSEFWKKALYPLACLVMVALALPFAYMHARAGSVSFKVFGGIMLGISFVLLNNLAGHIGLLRGWTPWVAAAAPSLIYLLLSMAAFAWLVRYR